MTSHQNMTPDDLRAWRKEMKLSQEKAGTRLGYGKTTIYYFEKGTQEIPLAVGYACAAIKSGMRPYKKKPPA